MFKNMSEKSKLNTIKISVVLIVIIFISLIVFALMFTNKNSYGNSVNINNFDQKVQNLPKDRKDSIAATLYNTLQINLSDKSKISSINDVVIREGSEKQDFDSTTKVYTGSFIVDVASVKQSYLVSYVYSQNPDDGNMTGYPVMITCLESSKLIYGEFDCKDILASETTGLDPILKYLPYDALDFEIKATRNEDGTVKNLHVTLLLSDADYNTGIDAAIATYKQEALEWIKSAGFDPAKYTINYTY